MPEFLEHLWTWFFDLNESRGAGFGPSPLTFSDLQAWAVLTGNRPTRWEVKLLRRIDGMYLKHLAETTAQNQNGG